MSFSHMLGLTFINFYVFGAIVGLIAIDMVDDLSGFERTPEDCLRDYSVFVASVIFAVGLTFALAHSHLSMLFSVAVLGLPSGRIALCV